MTPSILAGRAVRLAVDLAKTRLADAQRDFEITVREICYENAPEPGAVLNINTYTWTTPSNVTSAAP